jgi:hypothetical protein
VPTVLSGVVSDNTILADQRVIDMSDVIAQLEDDISPLTTMMQRIKKKKPARSNKINWMVDELVPRLTTLAASAASNATVLGVATGTGQYFRARDIVRIASTGENVAVTAVATDSLGITRSIGSQGEVSAQSGVDLIKVGNAALQGATLGTLVQTKKAAVSNYTQIQRDPWGFTNTTLAEDYYGGDLDSNERGKKFIEHRRQIEQTLFFGQRDLDTSGAQPVGYCGGILDYISTNATAASSGALTQTVWETWLRDKVFRYGSRNKVVFVTPLVQSALNSFPLAKLAPDSDGSDVKSWGVQLMKYIGGGTGGTVNLAVKRDWSDFNVTGSFGGTAIAVDMEQVCFRPMNGRDTKLLPNRQATDEDSAKKEYLTEYSVEWGDERNHAKLTGVTAFS